jgi:hypothetical protein
MSHRNEGFGGGWSSNAKELIGGHFVFADDDVHIFLLVSVEVRQSRRQKKVSISGGIVNGFLLFLRDFFFAAMSEKA